MMDMNAKIFIILIIIIITSILSSGCLEGKNFINNKPIIEITFPKNGMYISSLISIYGNASDPDGNETLVNVQIKIDDIAWVVANGKTNWSCDIGGFSLDDGIHTISARSWDGYDFSFVEEIAINFDLPDTVLSDARKWAIFIAADNFPEDNNSKLGNGGLNLAENMSTYFIEKLDYSTSNIYILFDDGWFRSDNGYGNPILTLQERPHKYNITYGAATIQNVMTVIQNVTTESNKFVDSEVFIWLFGHGYGNSNRIFTGGKLLKQSAIFLWDDIITDQEFGNILINLKSKKTCVIVDACYSGGFADKTIYNIPEIFILQSGLAKPGRIIISGTSKFRLGYASTNLGPIFTNIWFQGLISGDADGFRSGILHLGRQPIFGIFKDGKVSVEEAFFYSRFVFRKERVFIKFKMMEPQINDKYPQRGLVRSRINGMFL